LDVVDAVAPGNDLGAAVLASGFHKNGVIPYSIQADGLVKGGLGFAPRRKEVAKDAKGSMEKLCQAVK
jgi:hypothetical protein